MFLFSLLHTFLVDSFKKNSCSMGKGANTFQNKYNDKFSNFTQLFLNNVVNTLTLRDI